MAPDRSGRLLPVIVAAAAALAGPAFAWEDIEGTWCDKEKGCAHWDTRYTVRLRADRQRLLIGFTDYNFGSPIFHLKVPDADLREPKVKWTVTGKIKGFDLLTGTAEGKLDGPPEATTKLAALQIKGTLKKKDEARGISFEGAIADGTMEVGTGTIRGTVKGTARGERGGESVEGPFEGTLERSAAGWALSGVYVPPPDRCSRAGRSRSKLEWEQREYRLARPSLRAEPKQEKVAGGKSELAAEARLAFYYPPPTKEERQARVKAGRAGQVEAEPERGRFRRSEAEKDDQRIRLRDRERRLSAAPDSAQRLEAVSRPTKAPREAEEVLAHGKFTRTVEGTLSADKETITLDLPPRPALNENCQVTDTLPGGKLVLQKQEPPGR